MKSTRQPIVRRAQNFYSRVLRFLHPSFGHAGAFNSTLSLITCLAIVGGCKNRDINEGGKFHPRELIDNFNESHFTEITVDNIEYIIMERDNNNPHEGFGFMAFRANKLMEKQDTILAYIHTIKELQVRTYAAASKRPIEEVEKEVQLLFNHYLNQEEAELSKLEENNLEGKTKPNPTKD